MYKDSDDEFLDMIVYFWRAKRDLTRYCYYDEQRLYKLAPNIWSAWVCYQLAEKNMAKAIGEPQ